MSMNRRICSLGIALIALVWTAFPVVAARFDFPDPVGFVNDFANVLSNDTSLEERLRAFAETDSTEIFVITVDELPDTVTIDTFVPYLTDEHPKWKAGQEKYDNGVIFTVVMETHDVRIDTGYGVEGALPDITAKQILENDVVPKFREDDYDGGVEVGVDSIIKAVKGEYEGVPEGGSSADSDDTVDGLIGCCFTLSFFLFPMFGSFLGRTKSWWLGGVLGVIGGLIVAGVISVFFPSLGWARFISFGVAPILFGVVGLIFDYIASRTYRVQKSGQLGRTLNRTFGTTRSGGFGGFSGGGFGGGGFGGGSGGSFGGGGASSKW